MSSPPWSDVLARMMFEQSPFSSVLYDSEGHIIAANAAFRELWGVDVSSAPPDYNVLTDPELERQGIAALVKRAFAGEPITTPTIRYDISKLSTSGSGAVKWVQGDFYPLLDDEGIVRLVMLTHIDLTERTEAEIKLRYAVADLQTLQSLTVGLATAMTSTEVAGIMLDRARPAFGAGGGFVTMIEGSEFVVMRYEGFNAEEFSGWRRFPIDGRTPSAGALRSGEPVFVDTIEEVHEEYPILEPILKSNGYASFATLPLRAHGKTLGTVAFHFNRPNPLNDIQRDTLVTFARQCALAMERAQLYESERSARAEAEAANRAKSSFLATMSHELRTPLNAIDGYAELLEMGIRGELNPAQLQDVDRIRRSQKHLLSLIDDLLSFARIESGSVHLKVDAVSVADAVHAAHESIAPQIASKGLHFDDQVAGLDLAVAADQAKLHQILLNLMSNAVKFTAAGGLTVSAARRGEDVVIEITDTGRGIPHNWLETIFQPFVQVDSGMTRTSTGTGLGLAIARDLARKMAGDIGVVSTEGEGSTFIVTLPHAGAITDRRST